MNNKVPQSICGDSMAVKDTSPSVEAAARGTSNIEESHVGNFNDDGSLPPEVVNFSDIIQDQEIGVLEKIDAKELDMAKDSSRLGQCSGSLTQTAGVSRKSLENDVSLWLKTAVGLDDKVFEKYESLQELNGLTLFSYGGENAPTVFASESRVPMRIAIRILCIRDGIHEKRSNPLLKFTSEQISEFLNEIFVKRDRKCVKLLREHIIKWNIDGLIFYAYKDGKEFQSDFHDLDIDGIYFRKAIIMRNERFKVPTHTYLPFCDEVQKALSKSITKETRSMDNSISNSKLQHPVQEESSNELYANKYKKLLCPMLSLDESIVRKLCKPCMMYVIYGSLTNPNDEFEKKFAFFLVCEKDEFKEKAQQKILWEKINESIRSHGFDLLTQDQRNNLSGGNDMPKNQCNFLYVMEKSWEVIKGLFGILLTTKNIFESKEKRFVTNLSNDPASPQRFYFAFRTSEEYFVFDPENYSKGFERQIHKNLSNKFQRTEKNEYSFQCPTKVLPVQEGSVGNGEIHPINHLHARKEEAETKQINIQYPRKFKESSENVKYQVGSILNQPECGGQVSSRALEFKSLFTCIKFKKENRFIKFQTETLRFASACLNSRVNGTIYFGVADSVSKEYKHGEVVGCEITEIGDDTRNAYTDELKDAILNTGAFYSEMADTAFQCISEPKFVEVEIPNESTPHYVIEVDIEAASEICKNHYFKVNLKKIKNQDKSVKDEYVIFVRNGSSTKKRVGAEEELFIKATLPDLVALRKSQGYAKICN